jgi:hypothetical protein
MKKFMIFAVSAIFCVALAMPAAAGQVKVGGMVALDIYYFDQDADRQGFGTPLGAVAAGNGFERTVLELPYGANHLSFAYMNDSKTMGAFIMLTDGFYGGLESSDLSHNFEIALAWWQVNPMIQFKFGRCAPVVSPYDPAISIGTGNVPPQVAGINFGNWFNKIGFDMFVTTFKLSDMFSIELALVDPDTHDFGSNFDGVGPFFADFLPAALGTATTTETEVPRIDVAFPLNFGPVKIVPSGSLLMKEYDAVTPGNDDDLDIWAVSLAGMLSFGPVTITGEIQGGENTDSTVSNLTGTDGPVPTVYVDALGATRIADANYLGYWADIAFKFGKATFHGIIGGQQMDCDGSPVDRDAAEYDSTRAMYGITVPIMVSPGFFITPELMFYDYGNDNERWNTTTGTWDIWDDGEERIFGVQFKLIF